MIRAPSGTSSASARRTGTYDDGNDCDAPEVIVQVVCELVVLVAGVEENEADQQVEEEGDAEAKLEGTGIAVRVSQLSEGKPLGLLEKLRDRIPFVKHVCG
eukprot:scaffold1266_cov134-Pinguiococcus_pyrenoidosus.AAC.3